MKDNLKKTFRLEIETTTEKTTTSTKATPTTGGQMDLFAAGGGSAITHENNSKRNLSTTPHHYQYINTTLGVSLLIEKLMHQKSVCFDTETTSLNALAADLVGIAFSWEVGTGYYVSIPEDKSIAEKILEQLRPFFENKQVEKIGHNLKYDLKVLSNYNITVAGPLYDTLIAHYLINLTDVMEWIYWRVTTSIMNPNRLQVHWKKRKNQGSMRDVPLEQQTEYAVDDADITFQLKQHFDQELAAAENGKLFHDVELPLVEVLTAMEQEGINLNTTFLKNLESELAVDINRLEKDIFAQAGEEFNLASPKQLGPILFEKLKLVDKPKKTKTGQYSTAEDVLSYLAKDHKIVADILEWRSINKLCFYVKAL